MVFAKLILLILISVVNINNFKILSKHYEMIRMVKAGWVGFIVLLSLIIGTFECQLHDIGDFVLSTALFLEPQRVPSVYIRSSINC